MSIKRFIGRAERRPASRAPSCGGLGWGAFLLGSASFEPKPRHWPALPRVPPLSLAPSLAPPSGTPFLCSAPSGAYPLG